MSFRYDFKKISKRISFDRYAPVTFASLFIVTFFAQPGQSHFEGDGVTQNAQNPES